MSKITLEWMTDAPVGTKFRSKGTLETGHVIYTKISASIWLRDHPLGGAMSNNAHHWWSTQIKGRHDDFYTVIAYPGILNEKDVPEKNPVVPVVPNETPTKETPDMNLTLNLDRKQLINSLTQAAKDISEAYSHQIDAVTVEDTNATAAAEYYNSVAAALIAGTSETYLNGYGDLSTDIPFPAFDSAVGNKVEASKHALAKLTSECDQRVQAITSLIATLKLSTDDTVSVNSDEHAALVRVPTF